MDSNVRFEIFTAVTKKNGAFWEDLVKSSLNLYVNLFLEFICKAQSTRQIWKATHISQWWEYILSCYTNYLPFLLMQPCFLLSITNPFWLCLYLAAVIIQSVLQNGSNKTNCIFKSVNLLLEFICKAQHQANLEKQLKCPSDEGKLFCITPTTFLSFLCSLVLCLTLPIHFAFACTWQQNYFRTTVFF
jgi:hypothetical protein